MKDVLTLYTRPGCHLCDALFAAAEPIAREHGYRIETVNIDHDRDLKARYGLDIPVLVLGEREICRHRIDESELRQALED